MKQKDVPELMDQKLLEEAKSKRSIINANSLATF